MSVVLKALVGALGGFFVCAIIGTFIGYFLAFIGGALGLGAESAAVTGTLTGVVAGAAITVVTWSFDPLFFGDKPRYYYSIPGAIFGGVIGYLVIGTASDVYSLALTGLLAGGATGLVVGILVAIKSLDTRDRHADRTAAFDAFYRRRRAQPADQGFTSADDES